jgi:hypothetical protein
MNSTLIAVPTGNIVREYREWNQINVYLIICHKGTAGEQRCTSNLSVTLALGRVGWLTPRPGRLTHGKDAIPIV